MKTNQSNPRAFTLIELLIVVAIIAILAAIAVPNFLEAQVRSKISRASSDMRTISVGMESYIVDWNNEPATLFPGWAGPGYSAWWGFVSTKLTTPVAYLTSIPTMPFYDETVLGFWKNVNPGNSQENQPYTTIRDTATAMWPVGAVTTVPSAPSMVIRAPIPQQWRDNVDRSGYVIYTSGADRADGTVWGSPVFYDPSNGTISYGDIYRFGSGDPGDNDRNK